MTLGVLMRMTNDKPTKLQAFGSSTFEKARTGGQNSLATHRVQEVLADTLSHVIFSAECRRRSATQAAL